MKNTNPPPADETSALVLSNFTSLFPASLEQNQADSSLHAGIHLLPICEHPLQVSTFDSPIEATDASGGMSSSSPTVQEFEDQLRYARYLPETLLDRKMTSSTSTATPMKHAFTRQVEEVSSPKRYVGYCRVFLRETFSSVMWALT